MPCPAHQFKNTDRTGGRVLCFECFRRRVKRDTATAPRMPPFLRALSPRGVEHRRLMLANLQRAER